MTSLNIPQGTLQNTIPLMLGHPDPATLLPPELLKSMQDTISSPQAYTALQYGAEQGAQSLIDFLLDKISREQDLPLQPANLMIVAGSTHAVDMLTRLYAGRSGTILVEAPTYVDALHIFRDHEVELYSIPTDDDGLIPAELDKKLAQLHSTGIVPSFLYTIPNFHNPEGSTLPEGRRIKIIELAQQYGFLIVEDDVYRDLSFEGKVPASFYALTNGEQALSIGSFSKTLAPGLRLGWLLGSEDAIQHCINCGTTQMGGGANPFVARIVAEYCQHGYWQKHIKHLQSLYKMRCDVALSALSKYMPTDVKWTHPTGGFFIWLTLPTTVFAQDVKRQALQQGVLVAAGEGFFVNPSDGAHNLRLAYSCAKPSDIDTGIRILSQVIHSLEAVGTDEQLSS
jgi:2-aminoadipate transaminase